MTDLKISMQKIDCKVRHAIPPEDKDITEIIAFPIEYLKICLSNIEIYLRSPEDCPYARGNWIIDLIFKDGRVLCIKLPKEMEKSDVLRYCAPLLEFLNVGDKND